jgi:hypothetical protein
MTKPRLSAVRDLNPPGRTRPCSRCQRAEFIHADAGPCLFHDCECPFFIPEAEPDVEEGRGRKEKDPRPYSDLLAPAYSRRNGTGAARLQAADAMACALASATGQATGRTWSPRRTASRPSEGQSVKGLLPFKSDTSSGLDHRRVCLAGFLLPRRVHAMLRR